jgi:hypothetical protein
MYSIHLLLVILAAVCFLLAALNVTAPRGNLLAAGLFFWLLAGEVR